MTLSTGKLADAIIALDEDKVLQIVNESLKSGANPLDIVSGIQKGMVEVGLLFEKEEFFLSELIMCGEIMKDAMQILEPHLVGEASEHHGNIVIGTVKGDVHDLGKNIVVMLLKGAGYNVIDLGVDVSEEKFIHAIKENKAPLVGMSVLLTACQEGMKDIITSIRNDGLDVKIIIGGNYVDDKVKDYVGADWYATKATDAISVAREVFEAQ